MADNSYVPVDTGEYPVANLGRFLGASKPQYEAYVTTTPIENIPERMYLRETLRVIVSLTLTRCAL